MLFMKRSLQDISCFLFAALLCFLGTSNALAQSPKKLLQQDFTNFGCGPCHSAHQILLDQMENYGHGDLIHITYHTNFPSPTDGLYLANPSDQDYVISFYANTGVPNLWSNGQLPMISEAEIDAVLASFAPIELHATGSYVGRQLEASVRVLTTDAHNLSNCVLRVAVTENIVYEVVAGAINHTDFPSSFRTFLTPLEGDGYSPAAQGDSVSYNFSFTVPAEWNIEELRLKAWIEDSSRTEFNGYYFTDVINSVEAKVEESEEASVGIAEPYGFSLSESILYPNPLVGDEFYLSGLTPGTEVHVTDQSGRLVLNTTVEQTSSQVSLPSLSPGAYHVHLIHDGAHFTHHFMKP